MFPEAIPSLAAIFYNKVTAKAFRNFYREVAHEVTQQVKAGRILDIATGPGYLPIEIAKSDSNLDVTGIDLSPKMVEIALKNAKRGEVKNVTFEWGDANALSYADNSFDFVISTAALHHWRDIKGIFNNINRVLKKGGTCWIYDLRKDARKNEIGATLKRPGSRLGYMRWAFKFHGLKTEDYFKEIAPISKQINLNNFSIEAKNAMMKIAWNRQ